MSDQESIALEDLLHHSDSIPQHLPSVPQETYNPYN